MANPEHLTLLKQGVEAWNKWRQANPDIETDLIEVDLPEADLGGVNLSGADLGGANLGGANLRGADLGGADLREGGLYEANLYEVDLLEANLGGADLYGADLRRANLYEADLRRANLRRANLRRANLRGANLREVSLYGANFYEANLRRANLSRAALRRANLGGADLSEATLQGAELGGAILRNTIFSDVNLAEVQGLDTCLHTGPSSLDFRTLQQSGTLPLAFLRGCGLPDLLIDYLPSLLNQPIQYYSCFISYSSKDEDFALRLHADLQNKGVRCWLAPEDIQGGRKLHEQMGEAIQLQDRLLLVLSEHSMNSECEWVKTEIAEARQREVREKRQVLFPISLVDYEIIKQWKCFDADTGKDSAREIREYFIPDFSNWKSHDAYQAAFDRLLRDLKPALQRKPEAT